MRKTSLVLLIILCMCLNSITAFAFPEEMGSDTFVNQIVYQSLGYEEIEQGKLRMQKSIVQDTKDEFTITLSVDTYEDIKNIIQPDVSVVLILDNSYSMTDSKYKDKDGNFPLDYVEDAAIEFVNAMLPFKGQNASNNKSEIALIKYSDWAYESTDFIKDSTILTSKIREYFPGPGGTFTQDALKMAREMLEQGRASNENKIIIILSDGMPNTSYRGIKVEETNEIRSVGNLDSDFKITEFDYTSTVGGGYYLYGSSYSITTGSSLCLVDNNGVPTISEALKIKTDLDVPIYSILITTAFENNLTDTNGDYIQSRFVMSNIASSGEYLEVTDIHTLVDEYLKIVQDIISRVKLWTIHDPMGDLIEWRGFSDGIVPAGASFDTDNKILSWNMLDKDVKPILLDSSYAPYKYCYSLSYKIKLDTASERFIPDKNYPANKTTTLRYSLMPIDSQNNNIHQVEFDVPIVTGYDKLTLMVSASNLVAYIGGNSTSGNTFPYPHFKIEGFEDEDHLESIKFFFEDDTGMLKEFNPSNSDFGHYYDLPFEETFYYIEHGEYDSNNPALNDDKAGLYYIDVNGFGNRVIRAQSKSGYWYKIVYKGGTLYVRDIDKITPTYIHKQLEEEPVQKVTIPSVLIPENTEVTDSLGKPFSATVAMLSDSILIEETKAIMLERLNENPATKGKQYAFYYLDLVDPEDGNHVLTPNGEVTVYLPYPNGTNATNQFMIMHFAGVDRDSDYHVPSIVPEWITPVNTPYGLKFNVSSFSPFAIAYATNTSDDVDQEDKDKDKEDDQNREDNKGSEKNTAKYHITYYSNNGLNQESIWERNIKVGSSVTISNALFQPPTGQVFKGWSLSPNGEILYYGGERIKMPAKSLQLYAIWGNSNGPTLNKYNHFDYILGYPDQTVRPNAFISREEVATIFFRLLTEQSKKEYLWKENDFRDMSAKRWSNVVISTLKNADILKGVTAHSFEPEKPITRAEFAAIASRFDHTTPTATIQFSDIQNHWAEKEIMKAAALGWVKGYDDNTFRPNSNITRAEAITLINRVLERYVEKEEDLLSTATIWIDNKNVAAWYYFDIQEATHNHDYVNYENGNEKWIQLNVPIAANQ